MKKHFLYLTCLVMIRLNLSQQVICVVKYLNMLTLIYMYYRGKISAIFFNIVVFSDAMILFNLMTDYYQIQTVFIGIAYRSTNKHFISTTASSVTQSSRSHFLRLTAPNISIQHYLLMLTGKCPSFFITSASSTRENHCVLATDSAA